ncbi:hypothetical protein [Streptomyces sp. NBC_01235]|uniref:hypothetical protein n=1 Tax=Streptomyces sp. NBC_01235 TaxID=2903788 RepID=UPI002E112EDC|nr:hypothetical protein OG289_18435 [Streptomyces sp. NBC_01235]
MDRRLVLACWRTALANCLPLMLIQLLMQLWDEGLGWDNVRSCLGIPSAWAVICLVWAVVACLALARRARGTGLPVTLKALEETQVVTVPGDLSRIRDALRAAERASDVVEAPDGDIAFLWRPLRGKGRVPGMLSRDEASGETRVEVRAGDGHRGGGRTAQGERLHRRLPGGADGRGVM